MGIVVCKRCVLLSRIDYEQKPYSLLPTPYSLFFAVDVLEQIDDFV